MCIFQINVYHIVYWSGQINDDRLRIDSFSNDIEAEPLHFHTAMTANKEWNQIFCCTSDGNYSVSEYQYTINDIDKTAEWKFVRSLENYETYEKEMLLQLKLDINGRRLLGTAGKGFIVWDFGEENVIGDGAIYLPLPHGVRNISTKMMTSNSFMVSLKFDYAVAGVRKNLYVWSLENRQLVKILDAHFGRIIQLEALTIGNWNCAITSSIDRSVKVWNINNIFEQVHVIDRHELQIDNIR